MPAVLKSVALAAIANAISLGFSAWLLDGFALTWQWWLLAVVLFTVLTVVLRGVITSLVHKFVRASTILAGLVLTAVALAVTDAAVPHRGFSIEGWWTWVIVTVIVWAAGVAYGEVDHQAPPEAPQVSPTR